MERLLQILNEEQLSCVVLQNHKIYKKSAMGIVPMIQLLDEGHLKDALVADKIVGKAAAFLMVQGKIKQVHAKVLSHPALQVLQTYGINVSYDTLVPHIINRSNTGICPMEACVKDIQDPLLGEQALRQMIQQMKTLQTSS